MTYVCAQIAIHSNRIVHLTATHSTFKNTKLMDQIQTNYLKKYSRVCIINIRAVQEDVE